VGLHVNDDVCVGLCVTASDARRRRRAWLRFLLAFTAREHPQLVTMHLHLPLS